MVCLSEAKLAQEYFINEANLEDKVRKLLPSQGGAGAGFDLSASTQIVPIIDLTESAEGSNLREDLQRSISFKSTTFFNVNSSTTTVVSNTGYFRVFGNCFTTGAGTVTFKLNDGATDKSILVINASASVTNLTPYDFLIFLTAGDSFIITSNAVAVTAVGITRQIADIDGNLVNP